ncbi:MAG TPA: alpha/beta hydrolase [Methylomirabilota bacterium]|jgi:3-oxoadipate enol-lactonase
MIPPIVRRSLEADGVRISYLTVDIVSPPDTLLLIHGAGVSARTWVQQLRGLADVVRPIAIDLPGRRESDAASDPTLATYAELTYEALRRLHSGPAFVVGHSLGGAVAQVLAERHPEVVKGLVLISTCAKMPRVDGTTRVLAAMPWPFRRAALQWMARRTLLAPSALSDAVRLTLDEIRECPASTIQCDLAIGRAIDLEDVARRLRVPTLILCGGRDELTPPPLSQQLATLIAGSRLEIVPSAGHMLPLEAPGTVNRAIVDFVRALAPAAAVPAASPAPSRRYDLRFVVQRLVGRLWRSAPGA